MSTSFFGGGFFGGEFFESGSGGGTPPGETVYCHDLKRLHIAYMGQPFVQIQTGDIDTRELDTALNGQPFIATMCLLEDVEITPCDLYGLDVAYLGQPFVQVTTSGLDGFELDIAYMAQPFVAGECPSDEPVVPTEEYRHGGKDDKRRGKKNLIFKPTGIEDRKPKPVIHEGRKTVDERVEETRDIAAAVREVAQKEFAKAGVYQPPIETMTLAEIDAEIGLLMRKAYRSREDEEILMLLMLVAQAL